MTTPSATGLVARGFAILAMVGCGSDARHAPVTPVASSGPELRHSPGPEEATGGDCKTPERLPNASGVLSIAEASGSEIMRALGTAACACTRSGDRLHLVFNLRLSLGKADLRDVSWDPPPGPSDAREAAVRTCLQSRLAGRVFTPVVVSGDCIDCAGRDDGGAALVVPLRVNRQERPKP